MLISLLVLLLFSNAVTIRRDKSILFSRIVISSLILTALLAFNNLYIKPLEAGVSIYGGLLNITTFSQTFNIFILLISAIILTLTAFYPRKIYVRELSSIYSLLLSKIYYNKNTISNKNGEQFRIIEYSLIIVFILCGAIFLISSADLISVFLAIELQSYGLYILSTLYRDSESSTSSGLTYFLLGGLSSCFILLGSALLYINSGTTNLDNIYVITNISEIENLPVMIMYQPYYFNTALIIMFIGFLFKVSAAPFHFWSPDVYDGIPTIVTTYVAIVAKISIFAFFLEVVHFTDYTFSSFNWKNIFILSSLLSLIVGSVLGLTQFRIKRLFAYSTISHVGFILLALSINSTESIQSYIFYILQYSISNLNAFIILITMGFSLYLYVYNDNKSSLNGIVASDNYSPIQLINQIKGYFYINPYLAVSLAITLFSFVGIPPIIGFFAKQMILSAAIDSGYIFMALVAILTSVIGAGYYLNLIKQIFFYKNDYVNNPKLENTNIKVHTNNNNLETMTIKPYNIIINSSLSTSISILTLLLLLFIYIPEEWFSIVSLLTIILFKA
uniref:NADH dehydrogenase subunit 2 n=1 Tax=Pseudocercospora fuligena TaxID=685502 RepID=UPI00279DD015|nr:NADH dehydrogenase subunit 2 [Pseudocercospora fuligena]UNZ86587.1 NADH dehydrogenase subunit 2 [Pseudocercospora fuligena]